MSDRYQYTVNNFAKPWTVEVKKGNGFEATTTAFAQTFTAKGDSAEAALADLRAQMEKIGWFLSDTFSRT